MSHTADCFASKVDDLGLAPFLPPGGIQRLTVFHEQDAAFMATLAATARGHDFTSTATGLRFCNQRLAELARHTYEAADLQQLETWLAKAGTLHIPIVKDQAIKLDNTLQPVAVVAATETEAEGTNHGEMSHMIYLRDHIQTAGTCMELWLLDPERYADEGKVGHFLLMSALHLLSTPAQLARFHKVTAQLGKNAGQPDWPHISLFFGDLEAVKPNGWRNKQDTFQMLAHLTLDAIEKGFLDAAALTERHQAFLGAIAPFLLAVGFPHYESSGSWEEVTARRTSVLSIEVALLHKLRHAATKESFTFLNEEYERSRFGHERPFIVRLDEMIQSGLEELGKRFPFESPDYEHESIQYREADAALTYILLYDLPPLLTDARIPIGAQKTVLSVAQLERLVLDELAELDDPLTNGMFRYLDDSYQATNFHTAEQQWGVNSIKQKVKHEAEVSGRLIDYTEKQTLRGKLFAHAQPAAWTHPLGQLSAWAARRSMASPEHAEKYLALSTVYLNRLLATVTGDQQTHAILDAEGRYRIRAVPGAKLPECFVTYKTDGGQTFTVPSPHTPLNWSTAMLRLALGYGIAARQTAGANLFGERSATMSL